MTLLKYPSVERIIEFNILAITLIQAKKSDKAEVLNRPSLFAVISECEEFEGDLYDKAAVLLKGLVQKHAFASANRRTAFITTKDFVLSNKGKLKIPDDIKQVPVMQGIREGFYTHEEIKEWIKNGKIKQFKR
jgi:prophage maintenance system killer protein